VVVIVKGESNAIDCQEVAMMSAICRPRIKKTKTFGGTRDV